MPSTPFNPNTPNGEDVNSFHLNDDADKSALSHHHTLGVGDTQASPGSHTHNGIDSYKIDYNNLLNAPTGSGAADYTSTVKHIVRNSTGATLYKGQVVYITGANGTHILVSLADADTEATSSKTLGFLDQDLVNNADGYVITEGLIDNVDTSGATTEGVSVWLSTTAGGYVFSSPPSKPAHAVYLGVVARKNVSNGQIFVKVQNGYELTELHNVFTDNGSVADNEVLAFNSATSLWINQTAAEAGLAVTGHTHDDRYYTETETDSLLSGKSNTGHIHDDRYYTETEMTTLLSGKSDTGHTHTISNVTGLQTALDGKAPLEGWTVNRVLVANGTGAITASTTIDTTELGYLNGVTSNIQTQFSGKSDTGHTHDDRYYTETETDTLLAGKSNTGHSHVIADVTGLSTSLAGKADATHTHAISDTTGLQTALDAKAPLEGWTANRVLVANGTGAITASTTIDTTELGYLNGVTSNIQTQISAKANNSGYTASRVLISDATGNVVVSPLVSTTELDFLDGVTSAIQTQLNGKSATGHTHITSEVTGLDTALAGKASSTHTHAIADVTGLQTALDGKMSGTFPTGNRVMVTDATGVATISGTIDTTELGYLNGLTSGIQSQLNAKAVAGSNGVPFAMAANATTTASGTALAINTQETATTVTFPTSRFSVTPSVTANTSSPRYVAAITSASSTGFTFIVRNVSDATGTTYTWNWIAVQMASGAVSG